MIKYLDQFDKQWDRSWNAKMKKNLLHEGSSHIQEVGNTAYNYMSHLCTHRIRKKHLPSPAQIGQAACEVFVNDDIKLSIRLLGRSIYLGFNHQFNE